MSRPGCQSGAVSFTAIAALALAVLFAALAIDVGRLGWAAKRLQDTADLTAMDAMNEAGWCAGNTVLNQSELEAAAQASAQRNGYSGDLVAEGGVETGTITTVDGMRTFVPGGAMAEATALRVTTTETVPTSLVAGGWLGGDTRMQRQAVAYDAVLGSFSAGSFLGSVSSDDSLVLNPLMGGLLGGSVNLSGVAYEGLATAEVSLGDLAGASSSLGLSAGGVDGFLNASMTMGEFLQVMAQALGSGNSAYADINDLAAAATVSGDIAVGDLLQVNSSHPREAADVDLNLFDLVTGAAQVANEGTALHIALSLNLPLGISDVSADLYLIEGPQYVIGLPGKDASGAWRTRVRTGQGQLQISINLSDSQTILGGVVEVDGDLMLYADFAPATSWLEYIECAGSDTLAHAVRIGARTGLVELGLGQFDDISDPASSLSPTPALTIDAGGVISMTATVTAQSQLTSAQDANLDYTVNQAAPLPQTQTAGTPLAGGLGNMTGSLASSLDVGVSVSVLPMTLGLAPSDIGDGVDIQLLAPVVNLIDELLLDPLLRGLGVHAGGVQVKLLDIQRIDPRLAG